MRADFRDYMLRSRAIPPICAHACFLRALACSPDTQASFLPQLLVMLGGSAAQQPVRRCAGVIVPTALLVTTLVAVQLLLVRANGLAAATAIGNAMTTAYLSPWADPPLPELELSFDDGKVSLKPGADILTLNDFLQPGPNVKWTHFSPAPSRYVTSLFFIDFGPTEDGITKKGDFFPFIHALWTDCSYKDSKYCRAIRPWMPPGNGNTVPNRYTFLLVSTPAPLKILGQDPASIAGTSDGWSDFNMTRLVLDNPGMIPHGYTYMSVHMPGILKEICEWKSPAGRCKSPTPK